MPSCATEPRVKEQGNPPGRPGSLVRWVPVLPWLPRYQRGWLTGDASWPGCRRRVFADLRRHRGIVPVPGVLIVRPDAPVFYSNAEPVRDAIEQAVVSPAEPVRAVVLVLDGNDEIDITTAEQLGKLADGLWARNVPLGLAHVHGPALEMAERSGLLATVGADHVFPATPAAAAWARSVADAPTPGLGRPAGPG
jgi:STAS domain-containing protein